MDTHSISRVSRVRHELRRRTLRVVRRTQLSPGLVRLTFTSDDLGNFVSLGFDDHIKLFVSGRFGIPAMRDYTPRRYDAAARELDIEFALHDPAGPATAWARSAEIGSTLGIGGPRGSFIIEDSFDWYVLAGDETALPAIARRLGELRPGVPVHVFIEIENPAEEIPLASATDLRLHWIHRSAGATLEAAIRQSALPPGEGYVWIAAEEAIAKSLRRVFVDDLRHPAAAIRAAAYWRRGAASVHAVIDGA